MIDLNGWWRIWIVLAIALLAVATVVGLARRQFDNELSGKSVCFPGTVETQIVSQPTMDTWTAYKNTPPEALARGEIVNPRVDVEQFSCVSWTTMLKSWASALAAALALLALVFVVRWIGAGFNRSKV
ncbi:hypothetical protein [Sphingomonas sp.]|uniref:hypothetical protein n=1 Tax=Sphingomonas sp. TaxID=28214 RepID=UPI00184E1650|nr:hypothetical protein [Sphingomonas sp.]MBA4761147.1 hypothetical protein [Sphingomonas sp.]